MNLADILPFEGGGSYPVQYELTYLGCEYYLRYRHGWFTIDQDDVEVFEQELNEQGDDGQWSDEETTVYLYLVSEAIRAQSFQELKLPSKVDVAKHPMYKPGNLPRYHVLECGMEHQHIPDCYSQRTYTAKEIAEGKHR